MGSSNYKLVLAYVNQRIKPIVGEMFTNEDITLQEERALLKEASGIKTFQQLVTFCEKRLGMEDYKILKSLVDFLDSWPSAAPDDT